MDKNTEDYKRGFRDGLESGREEAFQKAVDIATENKIMTGHELVIKLRAKLKQQKK